MSFRLPDVLSADLRLVFCGTAAGTRSAELGAYYAGRGNAFWATLHGTGLTPRLLTPAEFTILPSFGIGLTDIAKHCAGPDKSLRGGDFDVAGFRAKMKRYAPTFIAFNGKKAASVFFDCKTRDLDYGQQANAENPLVWVLPSTSGGARKFWNVAHWNNLAASMKLHALTAALR